MVGQQLRGVLFLGAHPDDETVMAGGTLAMLHGRGIATHLVCATDGRGGEAGGIPEAATPVALARVREQEIRCAAEALGATSLTLLGYEDPVIGPGEKLYGFKADESVLVSQVADLIRLKEVSVVLSHGSNGEYGHPAHLQAHRAALQAARSHQLPVIFYSVAAAVPGIEDRLWNRSDPAHLALGITPWIESKHAAMLCHRTQHALFVRRRRLTNVRDAIRLTESFHRHWPPLPDQTLPDDPFAALLLAAGAIPYR
jgi:LmbE family N-acetylglucosaminyl deacetylase